MSLTAEKLYQLLPAIYRLRDVDQGEPLKALIAVLAEQASVMEDDIYQLYNNWFIETCDEWVVAYIGDLLGVKGLHPIDTETGVSQRAFVANTIRYRRRKGTATVLEQLAFDISGWRTRAVEFFQLLCSTQHYNHIRLKNKQAPDIRFSNDLELLNSAFDKISHTVDVRHISNNRGRHNIPNIGIFAWRLQSYFLSKVTARSVTEVSDGRYTFDPPGNELQLFNRPQTESEITHLAEEINVPCLLLRRALYDELESRRQALVDTSTPNTAYFGKQPVFQVFVKYNDEDELTEIEPENIVICNLKELSTANWPRPSSSKQYQSSDGSVTISQPIEVAVDPVNGRLAFLKDVVPKIIKVSYAYGFSGNVGGGPYDRHSSVDLEIIRKADWHCGVSKEFTAIHGELIETELNEAIKKWNARPAGSVGVISILDNCTYNETLRKINIPEKSQLFIIAANWPEVDKPDGLPGEKYRPEGYLDPTELRPHLIADLKVGGKVSSAEQTPGKLVVDGLLLEGQLKVMDGDLGSLRISNCTLVPVPGNSSMNVASKNERLNIDVCRSICRSIKIRGELSKLLIQESIVDKANGLTKAIDADNTSMELQKCTVFGEISGRIIEAGNCIFNDKIDMKRQQEGCIRYSYVPSESHTPRCFRCQPNLEITRQIAVARENDPNLSESEESEIRDCILGWLVPGFTSNQFGHYAYAQLGQNCPLQIKTGGDNGAEMGVFNHLKQPQREANLKIALEEYLRLGLEAGIIYVT